jgi:hypothetical protein
MGLRHPDIVDADHECEPGYAIACALCGQEGTMWFIPYGRLVFGLGMAVGAVNVCLDCRNDLEAGENSAAVERALAQLDPATDLKTKEAERQRLTNQLVWLYQHRKSPAQLSLELVPNGAMGSPHR